MIKPMREKLAISFLSFLIGVLLTIGVLWVGGAINEVNNPPMYCYQTVSMTGGQINSTGERCVPVTLTPTYP